MAKSFNEIDLVQSRINGQWDYILQNNAVVRQAFLLVKQRMPMSDMETWLKFVVIALNLQNENLININIAQQNEKI